MKSNTTLSIEPSTLDRGSEPDHAASWKSLYCSRTKSAKDAVAAIKSGQRVFVGSNCAEPQTLVDALTSRSDHLADTEIVHILTLGTAPYSDARFENHFRHNAFFIGANVRDAVNECRADYTPIFLSEVPALFRNGQISLDYALVTVSPPDAHGYCSLGISVDVVKTAVETASHIIAEVNRQMPRTLGDAFVHVSRIDAFVESDRPLLELKPPVQTEVTRKIGRHVADLIEDGSTLQMGIGAIPDAVLACLGDKRNLGIHTEMFSDGILPLVASGVITGRDKGLLVGKIVSSFCMGTRALYDFVNDNPMIEFRPTEFVNDPFVIARNEKMIAINAAIEVDMTGQVCADSIGERFFSGIGGQVDFIRGAARSKGGKPIIALPSTAKLPDGTLISRIVPTLKPGAGVVTSRGDVHYVVTEWGVASLHGRSIRERALALIAIAHPDFRRQLLASAKRRHLVPADQPAGSLQPRYPEEFEKRVTLDDTTEILIRPIRPTDEHLLHDFHCRLSSQTVFRRYGLNLPTLSREDRLKLINVDYDRDMALIAVLRQGPTEEMVGMANYHAKKHAQSAQMTLAVRDDWQDRGIGTLLVERLLKVSRIKRLTQITAKVQGDNALMISLLQRFGFVTDGPGRGKIIVYRLSV